MLVAGNAVNGVNVYNNTVYIDKNISNPSAAAIAIENIDGAPSNVSVRNNILYTANGATTLNAVNGTVVQGNDYFAAGTTSPLIVYGGTSYNSLSALRLIGQEMVQGSVTGLNVDAGIVDAGGGGTISDADQLNTLVAYNLHASSIMRDAGLNLNALFAINTGTTDFYGVPVSEDGGFDIGASEFVPEPTGSCAAILAMAALSFRLRSRHRPLG